VTPPALTPVSPATSPLAFPRHRFGRQWLALGLGLLLQPELVAGALVPVVLWGVWRTTRRIHEKLHAGH
jgi:hypothetical protein